MHARQSRSAALILAAGFSSRMQQGFKALLPITFADGRVYTALELLAALYRASGVEHIVVVSGKRHQDVAGQAKILGLSLVHNPQFEQGMFSSACVGLRAIADMCPSASHCFVHPVDIPLVQPDSLAALRGQAARFPTEICIPTFAGEEGHPPLLPTALIPALCEWTGQDGLRGAMRAVPWRHVPVTDAHILLDMDTDADYAHVCAQALQTPCRKEPC